MSSINFTCDVCGREVFSCTFVNGMKFCAKCYQETFGETDKDRKIADLEAKLAESERKLEEYKKCNCKECMTDYEKNLNQIIDKFLNENIKLKKQLAEKENTLSIKSVIKTLIKHNNLNCSFRDKTKAQIQQCGDVYNSNYGYFNFEEDYDESLNNKKDSRFDIISIDLAQNKSRSQ